MLIEEDMDASKESAGFESLPDGEYVFICTDVKDGKPNPEKNKYIRLELTVAEGEYANRKIWHNLTFLPKDHKHHGMTVHAFHAFGLPFDGHVRIDSSEFKGRGCKALVTTESREWQGKTYTGNKVKWFITDEEDCSQAQTQEPAQAGSKTGW